MGVVVPVDTQRVTPSRRSGGRKAWDLHPAPGRPSLHRPVASQRDVTANGFSKDLGEMQSYFWYFLSPAPSEHAHSPALSYEHINLHHEFIAIIYQLLLLNGQAVNFKMKWGCFH